MKYYDIAFDLHKQIYHLLVTFLYLHDQYLLCYFYLTLIEIVNINNWFQINRENQQVSCVWSEIS